MQALGRSLKSVLATIRNTLIFAPNLQVDEPTSGLDPHMQQEFYRLIKELKSRGRTVFLSSHILPEIEKVCDRVGIIKGGNLAAIEVIDSLLVYGERPQYYFT